MLGDRLLGNSIERGLGAMKGLTPSLLETRAWGQFTWK